MPVYYRNKETGKIEAKFVGCDTSSTVFRNKDLYERFESSRDLPLDVQPVPTPPPPTKPAEEKPWWKFWQRG